MDANEGIAGTARQALNVSTMIAVHFDRTLLSAVTGCTEVEVLEALRAAIDAQLVMPSRAASGFGTY